METKMGPPQSVRLSDRLGLNGLSNAQQPANDGEVNKLEYGMRMRRPYIIEMMIDHNVNGA